MPRLVGRAGHQRLVPALDAGEIRQLDLVARVAPGPAEDGEIGDRQRARDELAPRKALVEHVIEPARLGHVALEAIGAVLLVFQRDEMVHLAGHRPKAAHLPHQPFIDRDALGQRLGQEFAGLFAEIKQDRAGLEHADRLAVRPVGIDDGGDLVVGADGEERRRHLLALADVHRDHLVGQPHLLQRDRDFAAVRRVPGVQFDGHFLVSPKMLGLA